MHELDDFPPLRLRVLHDAPVRPDGRFVVYWMIACRRTSRNFSLDRACAWCRELDRPLLVLEALRAGYPWASDRLHRFILDGMEDNGRALSRAGLTYYPYLEPEPDAGKGLLRELAGSACLVVTDDHPGFFYPAMLAAAATQVPVRMEAVDGNGLLPLRAASRTFARAYDFRRYLQRELLPHLAVRPQEAPLAGMAACGTAPIPPAVSQRWPPATFTPSGALAVDLGSLPINHGVAPTARRGGALSAREALHRFLDRGLDQYDEHRNHPDEDATSGLSSYLHFGHIAAHEIFLSVAAREHWAEDRVAATAKGQREGWWGMDPDAEAFLDQVITWRELGFNRVSREPDSRSFASLPEWARGTLEEHAADPRPHVYDADAFAAAETHDALWNAAQRQLLREGIIHNYLRMLWGKKILHWTESPDAALEVMFELNDRYALDGRDPNSMSGITWCLGRYDRPWGPKRPIFGSVRTMSSRNTLRKVRLHRYLERFGDSDLSAAEDDT